MRKRGRPTFQTTPAQRRKVSIAAGAGMAHEEIALALGISRVTLGKYFSQELTVGAFQRRLEVLEAVHRAAKKGNVAAARAYAQISPRAAAPDSLPSEPNVPDEGKKERAQRESKTAHQGTEWESLLTPPTGLQ